MILDGEFKPKTDEKDKHLTEGCQLERTHVGAYVEWKRMSRKIAALIRLFFLTIWFNDGITKGPSHYIL